MADDEPPARYWSYKTLLEDKKRCLTDVGHIKHEFCNSLEREGINPKTSQRALAERKRHHRGELDRSWDRSGAKTPPHDYAGAESGPHFSHQEFNEKKKKMQTQIRSLSPKLTLDLGRCDTAERIVGAAATNQQFLDYDNHNVGTLMNYNRYADNTGYVTERAALTERRQSDEPHSSQKVLSMKKRHHATGINATRLRRSRSESPRTSYSREVKDPATRSYQGVYPYGETSQAYPDGRTDDKTVARYASQSYMNIDKRRHCAAIDGDVNAERARSRDMKQHSAEHHEAWEGDRELYKPDFLARGDKYKSQYALQQHKKRHLAEIHSGGDQHFAKESDNQAGPYAGEGHRLGQSLSEKGLFTSQNALCFAKRGHIITLNTAAGLSRQRGSIAHSDSSSSCDVGKGISRMMHNHREDQVHTSQTEFQLKKKNHATSVHQAPRGDAESDCTSVSSRASFGMHALADTRRASDPHHSCKVFALKKKYHVTPVHVKQDSRLHPEKIRGKSRDLDPKSLNSQSQLNTMKKVHKFNHDAEHRSKPERETIQKAPVPRNGQWTPQHLD